MRVTDEMVHTFFDAFTAVVGSNESAIRAGLEAALAATPPVEGLETTAEERADLREWAKANDDADVVKLIDDIDRLAARLAAAEAEAARLREDVEPVIVKYEPWMDEFSDDASCSVFRRFTFGDLRRARAALRSRKGGENG